MTDSEQSPDPENSDSPTTEPTVEAPEPGQADVEVGVKGFVTIRWMEDGPISIEWSQSVGPVELLGASGYIEWQAKTLLNQEVMRRARQTAEVARLFGPAGEPIDH